MKRVTLRRGDTPVLTRDPEPKTVKIEKPTTPRKLPIPKQFRRDVRARKSALRAKLSKGRFFMGVGKNYMVVYSPPRRKLKGWQKENRKYKKVS